MTKALVVLNGKDAASVLDAQQKVQSAVGHIAQKYGPQVLIIEANPQLVRKLRAATGVAGVYTRSVPRFVLSTRKKLDETGRMGITAWNMRHTPAYRAAKRKRKGEGLSWGAPPFERERSTPL